MSKNRFLVLLENALNHLDIKDTIRTYLYILSAYITLHKAKNMISHICDLIMMSDCY